MGWGALDPIRVALRLRDIGLGDPPDLFSLVPVDNRKSVMFVTCTYMFLVDPSGLVSNVNGRTPPSKYIDQAVRSELCIDRSRTTAACRPGPRHTCCLA